MSTTATLWGMEKSKLTTTSSWLVVSKNQEFGYKAIRYQPRHKIMSRDRQLITLRRVIDCVFSTEVGRLPCVIGPHLTCKLCMCKCQYQNKTFAKTVIIPPVFIVCGEGRVEWGVNSYSRTDYSVSFCHLNNILLMAISNAE